MKRGGDDPLLLLSANTAWNVWNFRMGLVRTLQQSGYRIALPLRSKDTKVTLNVFGFGGLSELSELCLSSSI